MPWVLQNCARKDGLPDPIRGGGAAASGAPVGMHELSQGPTCLLCCPSCKARAQRPQVEWGVTGVRALSEAPGKADSLSLPVPVTLLSPDTPQLIPVYRPPHFGPQSSLTLPRILPQGLCTGCPPSGDLPPSLVGLCSSPPASVCPQLCSLPLHRTHWMHLFVLLFVPH